MTSGCLKTRLASSGLDCHHFLPVPSPGASPLSTRLFPSPSPSLFSSHLLTPLPSSPPHILPSSIYTTDMRFIAAASLVALVIGLLAPSVHAQEDVLVQGVQLESNSGIRDARNPLNTLAVGPYSAAAELATTPNFAFNAGGLAKRQSGCRSGYGKCE